MPWNHLGFFNLLLVLFASLCYGDGHSVAPNNGTLKLSIFGSEIRNGSWVTGFSIDKVSRNMSKNWNLQMYMNVSDEGPVKDVHIRGIYIDNVDDSAVDENEPITIKLFPATRQEEKSTIEKCYEDYTGKANADFGIVSRSQWNAATAKTRYEPRKHPAVYVVVRDGNNRCYSSSQCIGKVKSEERSQNGDGFYNFYIGGDGMAYESRGWDALPGTKLGGIWRWTLLVKFFGFYENDLPSPTSRKAFNKLLETGVCLGKISQNYRVMSYRLYDDRSSHLGDLLNEELKKWDRYTEEIDPFPGRDYASEGTFPIAFREEWKARRSNKTFGVLRLPVKYVVVAGSGSRCFTREGCVDQMQLLQNVAIERHGDLLENFYVGDDGCAYEGLGWDSVPAVKLEGVREKAIIVSFFGYHQSYDPSPRAMLAFQRLLRLGVWLGKISPDHKVLSYRKFRDDRIFLGDKLHGELQKLERYSNSV